MGIASQPCRIAPGGSLGIDGGTGRTLLVVVDGEILLQRDDCAEPTWHPATELIEIPAGVGAVVRGTAEEAMVVVVTEGG